MAQMAISKRIDEHLIHASWIRKLFEEGQQMSQDGGGPVYDFSLGNPELDPPKKLRVALQRILDETKSGLHRYMPNAGYPEARRSVASALAEETGLSFDTGHVLMTVGAAGALNVALKALCDPGDEVMAPAPYFVEYGFYAENHGAELKPVPSGTDFDLDPEAIAKRLNPKTRVILINNPNNPTGVVYSQETLNRLGAVLRDASARYGRPVYLLDDAPYRKLIYDMDRCPSVFLAYEHALMATSHSKDLAIPGERVGFLAISPRCPEGGRVADAAAFANRTLGFVNAPALMQRVVSELQDEVIDLDWYRRKRDRLVTALTDFGYRVPHPGGAFYLFPEAPGGDDIAFINKLKSLRVLTVPSSGFGVPGHFRIAYCVCDEVIEGALPLFEKVIKG